MGNPELASPEADTRCCESPVFEKLVYPYTPETQTNLGFEMNKNSYTFTLSLLELFLAFLFSLFLLAACGTSPDSPAQVKPTAGNTAELDKSLENTIKPNTGTSGTITPNTPNEFDCSNVNQIPSTECAALVALFNSTNGPDWADNTGWLTTNTPCTWSGIDCAHGHISYIGLFYNQLKGTLPPDLYNLSHLHVLALWVNQLYGPIPAELGELKELVSLELSDNQLTGPLPVDLGNLGSLRTLTLAYNQLEGSIPPAIGKMESLESLDLSHNQFSGAIPSELGSLAHLNRLQLSHNQLKGFIPVALGTLSKLDDLDLSYNQLRGAVPKPIKLMDQRALWGNRLEGTITGTGQELIAVDYGGVQFSVDPSLATSIWPEVMPATPAPEVLEGPSFWMVTSKHIRFTFADPRLSPERSRMGINLAAEAQILIYPLAELANINPLVPSRIETLHNLLAQRGTVPAGELPLLPVTNSAQVFHAQAQYLDFGNIQGLRFITQHAQDFHPVSSQELFYTFQGITNDEIFYVAAFFPVTTAILPDRPESVALKDWEMISANFDAYLSETTAGLNQLSPAEFTPDLTLLDNVITSLRLESNSLFSNK